MSTGVDHGDGGRKQHASSDLPVALQKLREEHARRLEKIEQRRAAFASERSSFKPRHTRSRLSFPSPSTFLILSYAPESSASRSFSQR